MESSRAEEEFQNLSEVEESEDDSCFTEEDEDEDEDYDEEYDSEFDEDEEDEDDEDVQITPESIAQFFAVMAQMVEDEVEDDENGPDCPCAECRSRRLLGVVNGQRNSDDDDDEASLEGGSPCCVCMRRKTLVTLPCCGAQSEQTSSTRFCASCVNQCLVSDGCPPHPAWLGGKMGECPRCKHLMVQMRDGTLKAATTTQILYYLVGLSNPNYLQLFTILFPCEYMPTEVFVKQDAECLSHVCRWGLLECKNGVYSLRKPDLVRKWVSNNLSVEWENGRVRCREEPRGDDDEDNDNDCKAFSLLGAFELAAICKDLVMEKKILLTLRFANRISLLMLEAAGVVPSMSEWRTPGTTRYRAAMFAVSTLNLYFWVCLLKALVRVVLSAGAVLPGLTMLHSGANLLLPAPKKQKESKGPLLMLSQVYCVLAVFRFIWSLIPGATPSPPWSVVGPLLWNKISSLWKYNEPLVWTFGILGGLVWLLEQAPKLVA